MKNQHAFFIIVLVAVVILVTFDLVRREDSKVVIAARATPRVVSPVPTVTRASFVAEFNREADEILKLQNDQAATKERVKQLARRMNSLDVQDLYEVIADDRVSDEKRSLAVDVLSTKNDTASLMVLQNFVASKTLVSGKAWDPKKELETVLRAQAVETIAAYPQRELAASTLNFLQLRVEESFLSERIGRASARINGYSTEGAPAPADENIEQLVQ